MVLASVSVPSGTRSRLMTRIQIMSGVISMISLVDLMYNGESAVNKKDGDNILKKYKISKLNQLVKQIKSGVVFTKIGD